MILYYCPVCGTWQDVSLAEVVKVAFAPLAKWSAEISGAPYEEPPGYPCPAGHGLMAHIQPHEKIMLRSVEPRYAKRENS